MMKFKKYEDIPDEYEGMCIIEFSGCMCWLKQGRLHRIGGPARIYFETNAVEYYINGQYFSLFKMNQYWNHPLVVEEKLKRIDGF